MRNAHTTIDWTKGRPTEPGTYLVYLNKPNLGTHYHVARLSRNFAGQIIMLVGGYFAFDILTNGRDIVAYTVLDESHAPMEE